MKTILDVGSSTIKVYKLIENKLSHIKNKTIFFKDRFSPEKGISKENKELLIQFLKELNGEVEIYATSIFRKMNKEIQNELINNILKETGFIFNILSHKEESMYIQKALIDKYDGLALIINIGGGSSELILVENKKEIESHNLENLGVGTILTKYLEINKDLSEIELEHLVEEIKKILPEIRNVDVGFYSGGELTYMQIAGYNLIDNTLFNDPLHPSMISFDDFSNRNKEVFDNITLKELEELMPDNPKWMHGARACSAIAQAIFDKYEIKKIIPSNVNLIDGIILDSGR